MRSDAKLMSNPNTGDKVEESGRSLPKHRSISKCYRWESLRSIWGNIICSSSHVSQLDSRSRTAELALSLAALLRGPFLGQLPIWNYNTTFWDTGPEKSANILATVLELAGVHGTGRRNLRVGRFSAN